MIPVGRSYVRCLVLILFFASTLFLAVNVPERVFVSPDESAAGVFTELFATQQRLWIEESINTDLGGIVRPRSAIAIADRILPVSFLGLPVLYGTIGSLLGLWILPLLTPLFATLSIIAWRSIVKTLWKDERLADISAFLLMIHPAFWYYTSRVFMHNVLFVSLLLFAAWFWIVRPLRAQVRYEWIDAIGSGACVALALVVRGGEAPWVIVGVMALFVLIRKTVTWQRRALWIVGVAIALLPFAALQTSLFGAPWNVGYTVPPEAEIVTVQETEQVEHSHIGSMILPFGFHEMNILRNGFNFGLLLYPWMTITALIGMAMLWKNPSYRRLLGFTLGLGIWLLILYGSWSFHDNPDPNAVTIGDSHVRYWLPVFVLMTPFIAHVILRVSSGWSSKWKVSSRAVGEKSIIIGLLLVCTLLSTHLVFFTTDGVLAARAALMESAQKRDLILANTLADDIIIVDYADKYLFPDRRIVTPLRDERVYATLPAMVDLTNVYYFGITFPLEDMTYLNDEKLAAWELRIDPVVTVGEETLYHITSSP